MNLLNGPAFYLRNSQGMTCKMQTFFFLYLRKETVDQLEGGGGGEGGGKGRGKGVSCL